MTTHNAPLPKPLRTQLENTVKFARDVAEKGACAALSQLAVGEAKAPDYLTDEFKALRRRLRAHGRALGDKKAGDDTQALQHLIWEVAYEQWHRMLFARFLAENGLLLWEPGAAVSLDDCEALVQEADPAMNLGAKTQWELAGKLAARMLPQVFKPQSPVFELAFAPEHQRELERLLAALPFEVFQASDSLGWVYQFWQAQRKKEINDSEVKIGADELPAVTQLFTESYMVDFLLHNSLGAWWVTRQPGKPCPVPLTYLRTLEDGTPAAGKFDGWPDRLDEFKLLDPCCGSGHFLVAAFLTLVPMRMEAEGLSAMDAVDAVLADNLYGLELDARCIELAAFALAITAWRYPGAEGYRLLPQLNLACSGLAISAEKEEWLELASEDSSLRMVFGELFEQFKDSPLLGSLINPSAHFRTGSLFEVQWQEIEPLLIKALSFDEDDEKKEMGVVAQGLSKAASLLANKYDLILTNPPYLVLGKQSDRLRDFSSEFYSESRNDLATVFIARCMGFLNDNGAIGVVSPQNWLFQPRYKSFRKKLLGDGAVRFVTRLGAGAFEAISGEIVKATLSILKAPGSGSGVMVNNIDLSATNSNAERLNQLKTSPITSVLTRDYLNISEARITPVLNSGISSLSAYATTLHGQNAGDNSVFNRYFWEVPFFGEVWERYQNAPADGETFSGRSQIIMWEKESGRMARFAESVRHLNHKAQQWRSGKPSWGKKGIAVSLIGRICGTIYEGDIYGVLCGVVIPNEMAHIAAIWEFVRSGEMERLVREIDPNLAVQAKTLLAVPFDLAHWQQVAVERYPNGLPKPYSDDPTQWLFHGHPQPATDPLQVAVARLAGYRWPAETDMAMELADEARTWIARCEALAEHTDDDGIVCLPSVRGEPAAHDRLLKLLIAAWETVQPGSWKPSVLDKLLANADCAGKGLDVWLRDKFFEQHTKCFQHRPFIWQVWDGLKDGFAALVNYHQLDAKNQERLIHTYLGNWIRQQEAGVRDRIDGAPTRLAAAQDLKRRLELILEGEPPYDIFVRWKSLSEQPIGWNPDLNDGVRLNIRPFMTAEVLRHNKKPKLNITWDKDRGKDVESAPWYPVFNGDRINDHHLTVAEKRAAKGHS